MAGDGVPGDDAWSTVGVPLTGVQLTEHGLRFSSAAIFQLFESIPVAIGVTAGPHHRFVYANAHYRRALMLGAADPVGHEMRNALGDFLRPDIYVLRDRVLAEGRVLQALEEPIPPNAATPSMYWDITYFPLVDEKGKTTGILAFAVDVSDRVKARKEAESRAEAERRRAEEASLDRARLALAVDATALGIWEWNVETGALLWSDTQKAIWGLEPEHEATYEYWRASIHPEDREAVLGRLENTLDPTSGGDQRQEHRIVRPSGAVRWISSHGRMVYDENTGRPLRLIGTVLDTTRKKKVEEALRQALESREILLVEVNHRIKNSLQIVSSMLSLQSARLEDPGLRALIKEAQLRVHAVAAVHDRLYRSQDFKSVDLDVFLETLCRDLERTVVEEDAIVIEVTTEPVKIGNDRAVPIALILNELLTNAIKYAYPDRRGTIAVVLSKAEEGRVRLTVTDNGVGLPKGFAEERDASLGFRIIEGLARQIEGQIEIADRRPGTAITIGFDLAPE
jgi:PAS domain S-box-containing protein